MLWGSTMDAETAAASIAVMNNAFDDIFARKHDS
jgi:hypothetical protein